MSLNSYFALPAFRNVIHMACVLSLGVASSTEAMEANIGWHYDQI
jgi:hypothetical protein